jgi:hypothetical protein
MHTATKDEPDEVLEAFLDFLGNQINDHSQRLRPITPALRDRMRRLSKGVTVELDQSIDGPVSL